MDRPRRQAAAEAEEKIRGIREWEEASSSSRMVKRIEQAFNAEFDRELRRRKKAASLTVSVESFEELPDAQAPVEQEVEDHDLRQDEGEEGVSQDEGEEGVSEDEGDSDSEPDSESEDDADADNLSFVVSDTEEVDMDTEGSPLEHEDHWSEFSDSDSGNESDSEDEGSDSNSEDDRDKGETVSTQVEGETFDSWKQNFCLFK
jgi:hypothetical protein